MSLTEPQIQRYARQILLRGVGGKGQERLLERSVGVVGGGGAIEVAVAYLVAGGSPLTGNVPAAFLAGAGLNALSEVPVRQHPPFAELVAWPAWPNTTLGVVVLPTAVVVVGPGACAVCLRDLASRLSAVPGDALTDTTVGAMAALGLQRLLMELPTSEGWAFNNGWANASVDDCSHEKTQSNQGA